MAILLVQILILLPSLLLVGAVLNLAFQFVRAFERRGADRSDVRALQVRLEQLDEAVGRTASQVERLEEGQQFMQRLMSERASGHPPST